MKGSCLCGEIQFEVNREIETVGHCHCKMCQKAHGAAFGTYTRVEFDEFTVVTGEKFLKRFRSSDSVIRTFCSECGSTLQFIRDGKMHFSIAVGSLDEPVTPSSSFEIFVQSEASWGNREDSIRHQGDHGS